MTAAQQDSCSELETEEGKGDTSDASRMDVESGTCQPRRPRQPEKPGQAKQSRHSYYQTRTFLAEDDWCFHDGDNVNHCIIDDISLAKDGGISEVNELWYWQRWISAVLFVFMLVSNCYVIVKWDVDIMLRAPQQDNLISEKVVDGLLHLLAGKSSRDIITGAKVVCVIELMGLAYLLGKLVYLLAIGSGYIQKPSEFRRWLCISRVFFSVLLDLSYYSAMRLLHWLAPAILLPDIFKWLAYSSKSGRWRQQDITYPRLLLLRKWFTFVASRMLCFIVGFDTFALKVRIAAHHFNEPAISWGEASQCLIFIMQVVGIVQLYRSLQRRLFLFVFGGEDTVMQLHEAVRKDVWSAAVTRKARRTFPWWQFTIIMMTFDDTDFQKLMLNENRTAKAASPVDESTLRASIAGTGNI
eukprot:TRINITY_DN110483_c0_g1_i1.p1 TRINITY_DN110483_c0_g1~~TRINITY_DN110483_c0_g1_i1.p1  ORF type:complete len:412 (-),score=70.63 TRINITY_DN110483_c0_g1_i1:141-1376(-)